MPPEMRPRVSVHLLDLDGDLSAYPPPTDEELIDAQRLAHFGSRRRHEDSRRVLRAITAARLGCTPSDLTVSMQPNGRTVLVASPGTHVHLETSMAHRGRWCAFAVGEVEALGVDLEYVRPYPYARDVAANCFPASVVEALAMVDAHEFDRLFAQWWARGEAAVKACGTTLDDMAEALSVAPQASIECRAVGLSLAVATLGVPPLIDWMLPPDVGEPRSISPREPRT